MIKDHKPFIQHWAQHVVGSIPRNSAQHWASSLFMVVVSRTLIKPANSEAARTFTAVAT